MADNIYKQTEIHDGDLTVNRDGDADRAIIMLTGDAGQSKRIIFQTGGANRWLIESDAVAEGGADAGSDLQIKRVGDGGATTTVLSIERATGDIILAAGLTVTGALVADPTDASGALQGDDSTGITETIGAIDTWQAVTMFEDALSSADGTRVTKTVGAADYLEVGRTGAGEYQVLTAVSATQAAGNNQDLWVGWGINGADPVEGVRSKRR